MSFLYMRVSSWTALSANERSSCEDNGMNRLLSNRCIMLINPRHATTLDQSVKGTYQEGAASPND